MASKRSLALREQVGQLLIMGFDGTVMSSRLRLMLEALCPAGIILFQRNIQEAAQTHALLRGVQATSMTPMFRCVDLEGGTVDRLRDVIAPAPSVAEVAACQSKKVFRKHGKLIGREVCAFGFNTDFAPVLDLQFVASKTVLNSRTVSADPKKAIKYGQEFLRGMQESDILGCGKHFPGLGEGNLDSHEGLPSINKTWKRLWKEDLLPYRELRRDLPFIMVAHAAYPQVSGENIPASLSRKWMTGVLRNKIGYRGLIITDDLDMGGVQAAATIEDAAVETLRAGADLFLVCHKEENVRRGFEAVLQRAESDTKFGKLVAEKSQRVLSFKKRSKALRASMPPVPTRKTVEDLRRQSWEFAEEVRLHCLSPTGTSG